MKKALYESIKHYLADYKVKELHVIESGYWWKNKKIYEHILPIKLFDKNIIDKGFKTKLIEMISTDKRHLGFHHLNSSQALALNLFGPLVINNKLDIVGKMIDVIINNCEVKFEYIDDPTEGTNFDFYIHDNTMRLYFEVKYTENEFGNAKYDQKHKLKFDEVYKKRLEDISNISEKEFLGHYQLWRNIIYSKKGVVVFVIPKFRQDLINVIENAIEKMNKNINIKILYIDQIVEKAMEEENLKEHYIEFKKKYLNFA